MAVDNEELMMELQRVATLMRRSRRASVKNRMKDQGGEKKHCKGDTCGYDGHRRNRNAMATGDECAHGYGNHKCHGGSGRHGQNRILALLMMQDGETQHNIAYLLGIRPQSLTQALDTLEKESFIERRQDEQDKRASRVFLTDKGRGRAKKVSEDRKAYADDAFSMLTEEEHAQLATILGKINASIDEDLSAR
mgnify:CR=1 FL=1